MRLICQISWVGGGAPPSTLRIRLASTREIDAFEEMETLDTITEPNASSTPRTKALLLLEASDEQWEQAFLADDVRPPSEVTPAPSAEISERREMPKQATILLASDFTARSDRPLERALSLARALDAHLTIAHVVDEKEYKRLGDAAATIETALRSDLPDAASNAEIVVRSGSTPQTLSEIAAQSGAVLMVCGVARFNAIGDFFLGTAVDHIVRHAEIPVLVVRKRADRPYGHLLVATDFSECSRAALLSAARLFPQAKITLVHAFHVPFEGWLKSPSTHDELAADERNDMQDFLADPSVSDELRVRITARNEEGELSAVIHLLLREIDADLLVLGTNGRSGVAHATLGSNAADLLSSVKSDVLLVRKRKDAQD